jgi:choline dehydrogenase-like flavoprotein
MRANLESSSRNIMATTYAVAEKGADLIKADIK